jgi:hypothetical protein
MSVNADAVENRRNTEHAVAPIIKNVRGDKKKRNENKKAHKRESGSVDV